MARTCKKRVKNANRRVLGKAREFPKRNAYIITLSNGNQGAVTNRLQNEVASGKSVQETTVLYSLSAQPLMPSQFGSPLTRVWSLAQLTVPFKGMPVSKPATKGRSSLYEEIPIKTASQNCKNATNVFQTLNDAPAVRRQLKHVISYYMGYYVNIDSYGAEQETGGETEARGKRRKLEFKPPDLSLPCSLGAGITTAEESQFIIVARDQHLYMITRK
ncbi:hypothetical protein DFH08DRAFT_941148 [Mycena albidolilacea]|uniref:Uncharacterized protein n=1 Tax=Mycena albidolilacea TaxID=1033008 RepID=A0AAD7EHD8_9AGAR|nr:hypothetical protein DFH08DRAFT_941148 [Mycena albidolilacea]